MGAGFFKSLLEKKNAMKRWSRLLVCQSPKTGWQKTNQIDGNKLPNKSNNK
ncbi:hypothetical protein SMU63_07862 [Streptococcus mutans T4]|nr:hypothetical protein SMU33_02465 [Streptococcus mutans 11SSST2]EMB83295.1 hypothetical protein SMU53_07081 [Streptococcus mutans NVAB]EMB98769.1 hypothetical protein SMU63_07862 [Streptococcus mutans T4]EMC20238.1 hypothetical protein SMU80_07520 [Streptococcus mutans SF1]EMC29393.1 hypothetical protein SMU85_02781 [Streptococcus mutans ST6]